MNYRIGDRVIFTNIIGDMYKCIVTDIYSSLYIVYIMNIKANSMGAVNLSDIELDKEYYRNEKLKNLLDEYE